MTSLNDEEIQTRTFAQGGGAVEDADGDDQSTDSDDTDSSDSSDDSDAVDPDSGPADSTG